LIELHKWELAITDCSRAIQLDPNNPTAYYHVSHVEVQYAWFKQYVV
jgi:hypothetical protein